MGGGSDENLRGSLIIWYYAWCIVYFVFVFVCWCHHQSLEINLLTLMSLTESSLGSLRRFIESFEERLFSLLAWGGGGGRWNLLQKL